ncbi:MAG TPA: PAS domain-containing sensor histidine kinase [Patescibacteria group bacterium]|nr:PAS domain-containing sensor histidine kinase [Patescibacteria group bacterium]
MEDGKLATFHANPVRRGREDLQRQIAYFRDNQLLRDAFDATGTMLMILNDCRQVIYVNKAFARELGVADELHLLGKRPGEVIGCPNATTEPCGCGASRACRDCAAVNLVLQAIATNAGCTGDVVLTGSDGSARIPFQFHMQVHPMCSGTDSFFVVSLVDASDQARRRVLERVFFHDITNTTGALKGIIGLLKEEADGELKDNMEFIEKVFQGLLDEILAQKQLLEAESQELTIVREIFCSEDMLNEVSRLYEWQDIAKTKRVKLDPGSIFQECVSDCRLVKRVLGNMVKNALEAVPAGSCVWLGCQPLGTGWFKFWVHNEGHIREDVQYRIFQRSFSTKGRGHGLGTYSMKLLGERYLGGKVGFVSEKDRGTTFFLILPCGESLGIVDTKL